MKKQKKKLVRHSVSYNSDHSSFYDDLNLYHLVSNYNNLDSGGRTCYTPDGVKYKKKGVNHSE